MWPVTVFAVVTVTVMCMRQFYQNGPMTYRDFSQPDIFLHNHYRFVGLPAGGAALLDDMLSPRGH